MTKRLRILALGLMIVVLLATLSGCSVDGVKDKIMGIIGPYLPGCQHEGGEATCTTQAVCEKCGVAYGNVLGHDIVVDAAVAPDCENAGLTEGKHCSRCDYTSGREVVDALGHNVVVDAAVPATCYSTGLTEGKHCDRCEEVLVAQTETTMIPHTYDEEGFDETCNAEGCTYVRTCAHDGEKTVVAGKAPTCTVAGLTDGEKCAICGDVTKAQEVIDALGHDMAEATCTAPATCKRGCGHTVGTSKGHSYDDGVVTTAPTCTEKGVKTYTCSACGDSYTEEVAAAGHSHQPKVTAPTCTEDGYITYTCSCGDSYTAPGQASTGHAWGEWVIDVEPTEETEGAKHRDCANCDEVETAVIPELSHEHSYTETVVAPTCTEKGYTKHTCRCGDTYNTDEVDALGHDEKTVTVDPTCTEAGSTTTTCTRCDYSNVTPIPATNHTYESVVTAPKCEEEGYTTHTCHCGESYVDSKVPALQHKDDDRNHACDNGCNVYQGTHADGDDADHLCDHGCGATLSEHSYSSEVTAPTCTEKGYTTYTCSCGASYNADYVDEYGHKAGAEATCTTNQTCTVCGVELVAKLGHNLEDVAGKPATCTTDGYTSYKDCSRCEYYEGKETISASHSLVDVDENPATCTAAGYTAHKACENCDYTEGKTTIPASHSLVDVDEKAATCTTAGYTAHKACENCDYTEGKTTIPAGGHKDADGNFKCDSCSTEMLPAADSVLTIEQAIALGKLFTKDTYTTDKYYITGVISEVYDATWGNMYITDGTHTITVYGTYSADGSTRYDAMTTKPVAGDTVKVYGVIGYYSAPQMKNGWITEVTPHTCQWSEATCETLATCSVCGATTGEFGEHNYIDGECSVCGNPEGVNTVTVSKTHTEIAGIAGVTVGENTGLIDGKNIALDGYISIVCAKAKSSTAPCIYDESIRLYQNGATLTVKAADGATMKTIVITLATKSGGQGPITVVGGTASAISNYKYTITVNSGVSEVVITTAGTDKNNRLYVASIEVSYAEEVHNCADYAEDVVAKDATCTEDGNTAGTQCSKCSRIISGCETIPARGHDYSATPATCTTNAKCACGEEKVNSATGHTFVNGQCACGEVENTKDPESLAEFTFGANGSASHADGSSKTAYTETVNGMTLTLSSMNKVYTGARDAKGNSCIKLGTSSVVGSFKFTVPENVTEVVIYVAKYKTNTTKITVNGVSYTISGGSNSGAYDAIVVDTSVNKTVTFTTVSGGARCMINTIEFIGYKE